VDFAWIAWKSYIDAPRPGSYIKMSEFAVISK